MNKFLSSIENVLTDYAAQYTPEGSEPKAIVHQWGHAIAYNNKLFAENKGVKKEIIISLLKKEGIY
jgi:DNA (cytosine-5)-methyltransferase 1